MRKEGRLICAAFTILFWGSIAVSQQPFVWPDLPSSGFVIGRAATPADVEKQNAVFSINGAGKPAKLDIPQYVLWRDDHGVNHPRVLVQAEDAPNGMTIVGLRDGAGNESAATIAELTLVGTRKPE